MTSTLLFAAAIVAFLVIIISLFMYIGKQQKKKQMEKQNRHFSKTADAFGISVKKKDIFRHRIIGCDPDTKKIVFVDYSEDPYRNALIELKNISGSRLSVDTNNVTERVRGEDKIIDRITSAINLNIHFKNNTISPVVLPIYKYGIDAEHDIQQLKTGAEHWNEIINKNCG